MSDLKHIWVDETLSGVSPACIIDSLPVGVVMMDSAGCIITFNRAAEKATGMNAKHVCGKNFDEIFNQGFFYESPINTKMLCEIELPTEIETRVHCPDKSDRFMNLSFSSVHCEAGNKIGTALMLQDITHIKKLEAQANRTGRLAAMGEMAVKIAHEIRNPLGSIELSATTLKKDIEDDEELDALVGHICSGVKSINTIISNLLLFIRPDRMPEMKMIDLHGPLKDSIAVAGHIINTDAPIEVITRYAPGPLNICGDFELLKQVALNLILNAIQAMPGGGTLTISTGRMSDCHGNQSAELRFKDSGCGIPENVLAKIFDPFFTTKKRGTGLGLTIVHNITQAHGGHIDVNVFESGGTEFIITLPLGRSMVASMTA